MTAYNISVTSDSVCPWCYIGLRRLQRAIAMHQTKHPADTFNLHWRAFQLNPDSPRQQSVSKREYYAAKFGAHRADAIFNRVRAAAESEGIRMGFDGRTGNTWDSHRVATLAAKREKESGGTQAGLQTKVVEELFKAFFETQEDITQHDVLAKIGVRAGLEETDVKEMLEKGEEEGKIVDREVRASREDGINGVPYFEINGTLEVEGGQEPEAFLQIFERIKKKSEMVESRV